jgi:hypothetical protein
VPRNDKEEIGATKLVDSCQFYVGLEHGARGIAVVNICYQETSGGDTAEEYLLLEAVTRKRIVAC